MTNVFFKVGSLSTHMRGHTGEMPHTCDICHQKFAVKERLKLHMRTHTGTGVYKCKIE